MHVVFRADASLQIGTGHVMRCITLADELKTRGAECHFICREHPGNLNDLIRQKGYPVHALPNGKSIYSGEGYPNDNCEKVDENCHASWLGASQEEDAKSCSVILRGLQPDWLIVDHYALDHYWEKLVRPYCRELMIIDDLADRRHDCSLLLDQTFGRDSTDYKLLVPKSCTLLCGSKYALLRPEFAALRPYSLKRRLNQQLRHLLITMGGVDKDNTTARVLQALKKCELPPDCRITIVLGNTAPWIEEVRQLAEGMPWPTEVLVGISDMAQVMADSDLAIGAAGTSSWERCCLGLPSVLVTIAVNQLKSALELEKAGVVKLIPTTHDICDFLPEYISSITASCHGLQLIAESAAAIADGQGSERVCHVMELIDD